MIKAVFFDLDNTLYDFERGMRHGLAVALQALYERLPATRGRLSVEGMIRLRDRIAEEADGLGLSLNGVRVESFRRAIRSCGFPDTTADEIAGVYFANRFRHVEPFEGAVRALQALRGQVALGIISNGNTDPEEVGLQDGFDHRIFSEEVGVAKPNPKIFRLAMERVPCAPDELLHVGDSIELDVMGAKNAGARTAWFNPYGKPYPDGLERADFEIADIAEVIEIVERAYDA
jgi:putative hydrolase of the HAD superfamily